MHCNMRQPDAAPVPIRFNFVARAKFEVAQLIHFRLERFYCWYTLRYAVNLNFDRVTLTFDLWPWTFVLYWLCRGQTVCQIWAQSSNPRRRYCDLNIWPYDLEHVSRVALCSGIVCTKFELSQAIRSWNVTIFMLIRHVTLWHWPLTRWTWKFIVDLLWRGHSLQ